MKKFLYGLIAAALLWASSPALASQGSICMPTTGTVSGLTLVTDINAGLKALLTMNSGASAPTNDCTVLSQNGQLWMDTNTNTAKLYTGTTWLPLGVANTSTNIWNGIVGGGASTLASASPDLCGTSNPEAYIQITGTTTITGFGSNCIAGTWKVVTFAGILTLTHNATTFILPNGGSNITTAAGDTMLVATIATGQYRVVSYQKADGQSVTPTSVTAEVLSVSARSRDPVNLGLTASVASNLLTVTLTGADGTTPSATNPVLIPFRDTTLTSGAPVWVSATAATSISTFATGATLGSSNNTAFRFWVVAFNNSGTIVLGLVNCSSSGGISPIINNESALLSSTSITGSATSAGVIYTPNGTTVTTKSFRILGYLEYDSAGLATAGTYASAPDIVQLFGPGIKKPGDIVQTSYTQNGAYATTASTYTPSATLPTTGASLSGAAASLTPTSAANRIRVQAAVVMGSSTNNSGHTGFIYNGSSVIAVASSAVGANSGVNTSSVPVYWEGLPNSASSITYTVYGASSQATTYLNGTSATQFYGSVANTFIRVEELMN